MRNQINNKFKNTRNKWIYVPIKSKEFKHIIQDLTEGIKTGIIKAEDAINLVKIFKEKNTAWVKFKSVKGRSNQFCSCEIITFKNVKVSANLSCEFVLNAKILSETPKSLKLYKSKLNRSSRNKTWKKNDSFVDVIDYPSIEEELTEYGYEVYKSWQLEKINMSSDYLNQMYPQGYSIGR